MINQNKSFEPILAELEAFTYSNNAIRDLINLLDRAISISSKNNSDRRTNACLNQLVQTKDKQVDMLVSSKNKAKRQDYFVEAKSNFEKDLSMFCMI